MQAASDTPIMVLIWGPGQSNEHYGKRQKLREMLKKEFHRSEVRFSEDDELKQSTTENLPIQGQELIHLMACDVCVVLDTSKGAGEEIAHFVKSKVAHKLIILTHEKYEESQSFPAALRRHHYQLFYSDEEYESCSFSERVTSHVKNVALDKYIQSLPV